MAVINLVGMDPSMRSWGIAKAIYDTDYHSLKFTDIQLILPEVSKLKEIRQNTEDLQVAKQLYTGASTAAKGAGLVFVEAPVGSQTSRGACAYGMCLGVLGAMRANGHALAELTASEIKIEMTGNKTAKKIDMVNAAVERYPDLPWPVHNKSISVIKAEHMADAIGAILAGIKSTQFQNLISLMRQAS